jgi:hypothetical protein
VRPSIAQDAGNAKCGLLLVAFVLGAIIAVVPHWLTEINFIWRRERTNAGAHNRAWNGPDATRNETSAAADRRPRRHAVAQLRSACGHGQQRGCGDYKL